MTPEDEQRVRQLLAKSLRRMGERFLEKGERKGMPTLEACGTAFAGEATDLELYTPREDAHEYAPLACDGCGRDVNSSLTSWDNGQTWLCEKCVIKPSFILKPTGAVRAVTHGEHFITDSGEAAVWMAHHSSNRAYPILEPERCPDA